MGFEVNGVPYLLTFDRDRAQWMLLAPSADGVAPVEIYSDAAPFARSAARNSMGVN
jgi:hypothetical protein